MPAARRPLPGQPQPVMRATRERRQFGPSTSATTAIVTGDGTCPQPCCQRIHAHAGPRTRGDRAGHPRGHAELPFVTKNQTAP